jgi:hypothetical protein
MDCEPFWSPVSSSSLLEYFTAAACRMTWSFMIVKNRWLGQIFGTAFYMLDIRWDVICMIQNIWGNMFRKLYQGIWLRLKCCKQLMDKCKDFIYTFKKQVIFYKRIAKTRNDFLRQTLNNWHGPHTVLKEKYSQVLF